MKALIYNIARVEKNIFPLVDSTHCDFPFFFVEFLIHLIFLIVHIPPQLKHSILAPFCQCGWWKGAKEKRETTNLMLGNVHLRNAN